MANIHKAIKYQAVTLAKTCDTPNCLLYQMSGIGKYPFLALDQSQLSFGKVLVGEQVEQTIRLTNQSLVPAEFTVVQALSGPDALADTSIRVLPAR